jgi:hypothetical protein
MFDCSVPGKFAGIQRAPHYRGYRKKNLLNTQGGESNRNPKSPNLQQLS